MIRAHRQLFVILVIIVSLFPVSASCQESSSAVLEWERLLENRELRRELEILDVQANSITRQMADRKKRFESKSNVLIEMWFEAQEATANGNREPKRRFKKAQMKLNNEHANEINRIVSETLVPFQIERLTQITHQEMLFKVGYVMFLHWQPVKHTLKLTDERLAEIREHEADLQIQFEKELAELKQKYRSKVNRLLKPDQKKKIKAILGEDTRWLARQKKIRF